MTSYGQKTLDCLRLASIPIADPERLGYTAELSDRYSAKAVMAKMYDLAGKGFIDFGVSPIYGWLTDAGREALHHPTDLATLPPR